MEAARDDEVLRAAALEVRPAEFTALVDGRALQLSVREFDLLVALARRGGRIVRREELHSVVWGGEFRKDDRSVDVYVHKLRAKLEASVPGWRFIHTHFGFGYRFAAEPSHLFHTAVTTPQQTGGAPMEASPALDKRAKEKT
jgi:DNA-binding response OmpR family regulator